jgi:signal transduction histidine kinase
VLNSLRLRLAASFLLIVIVTLLAAGLGLFARFGGYRDEISASTLRQVAAPIYYNLTLYTVPEGERPALANRRFRGELDEYLRLQQETTGVIVLPVDANGLVISSTELDPALADERFAVPPAPQRRPSFEDLPQATYTTSEGERLIYVTVPTTRVVRAQDAGIHAIIVALPQTRARDVWGDLFPRLLFGGFVGLAAALAVIVLLWASLSRTLARATRGIRAVAAGDYAQRVPEAGPTEIRRLAQDVNRMADSVQASQATLREFLANVSHELKTPLTSIRGFSQAMLDGTLESPEERLRAARVIDAESRRVLHLVGELLDLSRIESGQQRMDVADVRVGELLAHVGDVFALRAQEAGVALEVVESGVDVLARADFDRIEQVLGNLLDNALRHTPAGRHIQMGARSSGDFVELYVADDGEGVAVEDLPYVFDRFYRSALGERDAPGSGLGLAIAREIVRAHGGVIAVERREGGGTEFRFTLPRPQTPRADAPADTRPQRELHGGAAAADS